MFHRSRPTTTRTSKPTLMTRLRGPYARKKTVKVTTETHPSHSRHGYGTTSHPGHTRRGYGTTTHAGRGYGTTAHHHHRKASLGDKVSGAMLKLRGSLTGRPGVKAAGTRRMHGTDGRGSHHHVY
ncbi:hypothetical protein N7495_009994 [Penicillium taxi]|uniref:uncharacterized protein n=1 Tax=Penicillium taxi TaxID=168475 RepID=UPI0025455708|nr:uncharacterized protein N7495_009994 [Penicillium taxi]KAJ5885484.1 hypothetical protein N7495_009994 [Penicillium taxi]